MGLAGAKLPAQYRQTRTPQTRWRGNRWTKRQKELQLNPPPKRLNAVDPQEQGVSSIDVTGSSPEIVSDHITDDLKIVMGEFDIRLICCSI